MARPENPITTVTIKLSTTQAVCDRLDELAATGLFGKSRAEVAEELLRGRLREVMADGWGQREAK